jgi:uncharacterized membrane protein
MNISIKNKLNIAFTLLIAALSTILWFIPTGHEKPELTELAERPKALVLEVDNSGIEYRGIVAVGSQTLQIKVLSGRFKGDTLEAENILMGMMRYDKIYKEGDKVLSVLRLSEDKQKILSSRAEDLYRLDTELILFGLFALFLIGFGGWTGFKALLSFVFTGLAIWKVLIPLFLEGVNPLPLAFAVVSVSTTVIIVLISGFSRKGMVALTGAIAGVGITTILAIIFGYYFRLPGTVQEYSDTLLYTGLQLNVTDIFLAGIFISAAGAVMDVAMDIAASQNEIVDKKPEIGFRELMLSGFRIARPVIGTMTTTLLFAYSGSFTFMLMVFMAQGTPLEYIMNKNFIAAEILYTLVGSFGLVLVAPITSVIGGYLYTRRK